MRDFLAVINMLCSISCIALVSIQNYYLGWVYWKKVWSYMDLLYIFSNTTLSIMIINEKDNENKELRVIETITALLIWTRCLYFLQLINSMSPLIQIIFKIFDSIKYFLLTMIIICFAFANAFYLIGRN